MSVRPNLDARDDATDPLIHFAHVHVLACAEGYPQAIQIQGQSSEVGLAQQLLQTSKKIFRSRGRGGDPGRHLAPGIDVGWWFVAPTGSPTDVWATLD